MEAMREHARRGRRLFSGFSGHCGHSQRDRMSEIPSMRRELVRESARIPTAVSAMGFASTSSGIVVLYRG